jgi:ParE toxin of type II toxin-antitoxin system, parDE
VNAAKPPRFLLDLAEGKGRAEVAERCYKALLGTLQFIERNPFVGRERRDLSPSGTRCWRVHGFTLWLIFYSVTAQKDVIFY